MFCKRVKGLQIFKWLEEMRYQWARGLTEDRWNPPWRKGSIKCWVPAPEQTLALLLCFPLGYWLIVKINRIEFLCMIWGLLSYLHLQNTYQLQCALHFWKQNKTAFPNSRCFFPSYFSDFSSAYLNSLFLLHSLHLHLCSWTRLEENIEPCCLLWL